MVFPTAITLQQNLPNSSRKNKNFLRFPQFTLEKCEILHKIPAKKCQSKRKVPWKIPNTGTTSRKYHQSITKVCRAVHITSTLRGLCGSVSHNRNLKSKLTLLSVAWLYGACRSIIERVAVNGDYCRKNNCKFMKIRDGKQNFVRFSNKSLKSKV